MIFHSVNQKYFLKKLDQHMSGTKILLLDFDIDVNEDI